MREKKSRAPSGHPCGESHYKASISDADVREMRRVFEERKAKEGRNFGYAIVGMLFGVSKWTARDIVTYRTRINVK